MKLWAMKLPVVSFAAVVLVVVGATFVFDQDREPAEARAATIAFGPDTFAAAEDSLDSTVNSKRVLLASEPSSWLRREVLALALIDRYRLDGSLSDLDEARTLLETGLASTPDPAGPSLTRAQHALMLHDLDAADEALARYDRTVVKLPKERAAADAMRGDLAFQRGKLDEARAIFSKTHADHPEFGSAARLAQVLLWSGDASEAAAVAEEGFRATSLTPFGSARAALMLANLAYARGDLAAAGEWIGTAQNAFEGYWMVDAYAAQHLAAEGDIDGAIKALTAIVQHTQEPEVIDTLAGMLHHAGREAEARRWASSAGRLWEQKLEAAPDAYRLHVAEHYLDFGDAARALELAREEVAQRPFGEAIEVLASAYLANGQPMKALEWFERAEKSGYRAVSLDMARGEALESIGRDAEAAKFYARARSINPTADGALRKLLRFGHY